MTSAVSDPNMAAIETLSDADRRYRLARRRCLVQRQCRSGCGDGQGQAEYRRALRLDAYFGFYSTRTASDAFRILTKVDAHRLCVKAAPLIDRKDRG